MTREEAIHLIENHKYPHASEAWTKLSNEAIDMAIEALQREEAEANGYCHRIRPKDVEVVVRCKDCRWYSVKGKTTMYGWCDANWISVNETDYCSKGERQRNYFGERKEP